MKILFVAHYYLPGHQAGTELYTRALVRKFKKEGHQVWVFTSEDRPSPGFELKEEEYEQVRIFRLYHSGAYDFKSSYSREDFDQIFGEILDRIQPEIIHFQHLFRLSIGFVQQAKKRKIPSLLTLADYWLICPAIIMLKPGQEICLGPEQGNQCARCAHAFSGFYPAQASAQPSLFWKGVELAISYLHKIKRQLPPHLVARLREVFGKKSKEEQKLALVKERWQEMKKMVDELSLVISPSRFLKDMMINCQMLPPDKIIYSDYGFETDSFPKPISPNQEAPPQTLKIGFIGTLVHHKGVHLLIQAMSLIPGKNLELKIFGEEKDFPGYVHWLKKLGKKDKRIKWLGKIDHDQIYQALKSIDLLVVPSIWYENSPLTIHEAFLANRPVIASNLGGTKELLEKGGGITFESGNPEHLAKKIQELIKNPEKLEKLKETIIKVKTIEENYQELLNIYQTILS